jgi:hypothetical protein
VSVIIQNKRNCKEQIGTELISTKEIIYAISYQLDCLKNIYSLELQIRIIKVAELFLSALTDIMSSTYKREIVWTNVFLLTAYHYFGLHGLYHLVTAQHYWTTFLWGKPLNPKIQVKNLFSFFVGRTFEYRYHLRRPPPLEPPHLQSKTSLAPLLDLLQHPQLPDERVRVGKRPPGPPQVHGHRCRPVQHQPRVLLRPHGLDNGSQASRCDQQRQKRRHERFGK